MSFDLRRFKEMEYAVGTDGSIAITIKDSAGDNLDVTGATASWKVFKAYTRRRRKPWIGAVLLTKTDTDGITLATGLATIAIADTELDGLSGRHWQVLQITDNSGNVTHLGGGELFLRAALV